MKSAAFKLVAFVISTQLFIIAGIAVGCFTTPKQCSGERASELLHFVTAEAFALYAAEK
jgi:hypothetical protein